MEADEWKAEIERERRGKDMFFGGAWESPLPPQDRAAFQGLAYFPPDPAYRFEIELREHEDKKTLRMALTQGDARDFIRWGEFRFNTGGEECVLQAYKSHAGEGQLFVPFRDATSDEESYGAGRYIDLDPSRQTTPDGKWVLDFNRAYNPWCVYSDQFTCPVVPQENWLKVPIRAGEKDYPKE
jgi:uncharacterized protein (DUF1684 family)